MTIASEFLKKDDTYIYYICTKGALRPTGERVKIIEIESTMELKDAVENVLTTESIDCFIHSMAVSDYMKDYVTTIDRIKDSIKQNNDLDEAFKNIDVVNLQEHDVKLLIQNCIKDYSHILKEKKKLPKY